MRRGYHLITYIIVFIVILAATIVGIYDIINYQLSRLRATIRKYRQVQKKGKDDG